MTPTNHANTNNMNNNNNKEKKYAFYKTNWPRNILFPDILLYCVTFFTTFIHHVYCCLMFNSKNSQRFVLCVWFMKIIYGNCWLKIHDNAIPFPYAQANAALYLIIYIYVSWNLIVCDILLHCRYYNSFLSWDCILTISPYTFHVNNIIEPW